MNETPETSTEVMVTMPICNPQTGCPSRSSVYFGRVDMVDSGTVVDWKTTSDSAADIQKLTTGFQAECYFLALRYAGVMVDSIEYRFIQKPSIKYCKKDNGDPHAYQLRCEEWLRTTPGALRPHVVFVNPARLEAARRWLWAASKRLLSCRADGSWACNHHACKSWSRNCEYAQLCAARANGSDVDWLIENRYEKAEPRYTDKQGRTPITFSTAGMLGLCEMRYYWRHERHIKPKREDTGDALYIGSASHAGLESLFKDEGTVELAHKAIDTWEDAQPSLLGEDATHRQDQNAAQAKAMCTVAGEKWKPTT